MTAPVPAALRPYVASRVAYDVDLGRPGVHRGLPETSLTLVLPLDERIDVSWAGRDESRRTSWSCLSGLHAAPAAIHHDGVQRGIQLALTLAGARALLGRPAADLSGALVDLDDVLPELADLPERLHDQPTWEARVALVDRAFAGLLDHTGAPGVRAEVGHALGALTRGRRVTEVADEVGYSRRRLGTLVREECGLTPKEFQRVARFQASQRRLRDRPGAGLATVAAESGYSDQAHLTREWVALAGCTPTTWLREEFPYLPQVEPSGGHDA